MLRTRLTGLTVALALFACNATKSNDTRITTDVKDRLAQDPAAQAVDVATNGGIVVLRGYVDDEGQRGRLDDTARQVKGVLAVDNELEIRRPPTVTSAPLQ
jgi:osmotically-inducible protein OsmY